jgi:hypothetical protein
MRLFEAAFIIFLLNLPFGYWRDNVKKFSLQWILAIHVPVPIVIALRFILGLGFAFITYPILVGAFFLGQFIGAKIHKWSVKNLDFPATSCLACDLLKITNIIKNR